MRPVFRNSKGIALRLYLHEDDPKASIAVPEIIEKIKEGRGALVSSVEDAQCVIIFEPNEENAIKLQSALACLERPIPVLRSDWITACLREGYMLGPNAKPEWGGFRLKYYHDAQEFFDDEADDTKKEENVDCKVEIIELSDSDEDDGGPIEQPNSRPRLQRDGRSFKVKPRTAAEILFDISKDKMRYGIDELILMVQKLADTDLENFRATFNELAATNRARGKVHGVSGQAWAKLFSRNRDLYMTCIEKIRHGDLSLDDILPRESPNKRGPINEGPPDSPLSSVPPASVSGQRSEPPEAGGSRLTSLTAVAHLVDLTGRSSDEEGGPSRPAKRTFSAVQSRGLKQLGPKHKKLRR